MGAGSAEYISKKDALLREVDQIGSDAPFRVGIVPLPGYALMSYACTVEPLRAANLLSRRQLYEVIHFSAEENCKSSGGSNVPADHAIGKMVNLDLLLVVAGGDPFQHIDKGLVDWLTAVETSVPAMGGVSGGSVVLAQSGLMQGRRMTVHWEHAERLLELRPELILERKLYVIDRDRVTCGGGTAPVDLMHAIISRHHGRVFAQLVSDWFLHTDIRAAAAPQRALPSSQFGTAPAAVIDAVTAMENHVGDPLTLKQLAMITGVSARHLNRLFQAACGVSAMAFYRRLRLDVGRRFVTASSLGFAEIAEATGFATAAHFSNQYLQAFHVRPKQDRRAFDEERE